jgi:hypothetical protein
VENAFLVFDNRRMTFSSKWAIKVHHICVLIPFSATEKEIEATNYMLSHAMRITARDENITNKRADILPDAFF